MALGFNTDAIIDDGRIVALEYNVVRFFVRFYL